MKKIATAVTVIIAAVTTLTIFSACAEKVKDTGNKIVSSARSYADSEIGFDGDLSKLSDKAISYVQGELGLNNSANQILEGTWLNEDDAADWRWTFDGSNKCILASKRDESRSEGTYSVNESEGTVDISLNSWDATITFSYKLRSTLSDEYLTLTSETQGYSLKKHKD